MTFDFGDTPLPTYRVSDVGHAEHCGSGAAIRFSTPAILEVRFYPANAHTEAGEPTIRARKQSPRLGAVQELVLSCDFEAVVVWDIGVRARQPYRVSRLNRPTRLVLDVGH